MFLMFFTFLEAECSKAALEMLNNYLESRKIHIKAREHDVQHFKLVPNLTNLFTYEIEEYKKCKKCFSVFRSQAREPGTMFFVPSTGISLRMQIKKSLQQADYLVTCSVCQEARACKSSKQFFFLPKYLFIQVSGGFESFSNNFSLNFGSITGLFCRFFLRITQPHTHVCIVTVK